MSSDKHYCSVCDCHVKNNWGCIRAHLKTNKHINNGKGAEYMAKLREMKVIEKAQKNTEIYVKLKAKTEEEIKLIKKDIIKACELLKNNEYSYDVTEYILFKTKALKINQELEQEQYQDQDQDQDQALALPLSSSESSSLCA